MLVALASGKQIAHAGLHGMSETLQMAQLTSSTCGRCTWSMNSKCMRQCHKHVKAHFASTRKVSIGLDVANTLLLLLPCIGFTGAVLVAMPCACTSRAACSRHNLYRSGFPPAVHA